MIWETEVKIYGYLSRARVETKENHGTLWHFVGSSELCHLKHYKRIWNKQVTRLRANNKAHPFLALSHLLTYTQYSFQNIYYDDL